MQANLDLKIGSRAFFQFLHRFHVVIFVLVVIGGLAVATLLLTTAMNTPSPDTTATTNATSVPVIQTETIQRVKELRTDSTPLVLPPGRTNPFN
jgi:hypothetical protein